MTAPIPRRKQLTVIRMYFEGLSLDGIGRHAGVSKGSVVEIIRKLKSGKYVEFQDVHDIVATLREIALYVRKEFSGDLERCHVGSVAWVALNRIGLDPSRVPEWAKMCQDLASSDMAPQEFLEIALHAWRLRNAYGVDLRELPNRIESLKAVADVVSAKCASLDADAQAKEASLVPLREELGLSRDILALRSAKAEEESQLADAQSRRKAALVTAQVTDQGLEEFRVFAGMAKAKGVPVDGPLLDTLLSLVTSLRPEAIRDIDRLRRLLLKEGVTAPVGAKLLTGLWRLGFTLDRAAEVARALGAEEPFPQALNRFEAVLLEFGSWPAAVAASKQRMEELWRREDAQRAESERLGRNVDLKRKALEDLEGKLSGATANLEMVRAEVIKAKAECETQLRKPREELHRIQALRDTPFHELADRLTMEDYNILGTHMRKKEPTGPLPAEVEFIWRLMSGQGVPWGGSALAANGTPPWWRDEIVVRAPGTQTLTPGDRLRMRELLYLASLEGEGPLNALVRIMTGSVEVPPEPMAGPEDASEEWLLARKRRNDARLELRHMMGEIATGRRGSFTSFSPQPSTRVPQNQQAPFGNRR